MNKYAGNKIITFRLDELQNRELKNYCKKTGQKKSKVLRNAINKYLKSCSYSQSVIYPIDSPSNLNGEGI